MSLGNRTQRAIISAQRGGGKDLLSGSKGEGVWEIALSEQSFRTKTVKKVVFGRIYNRRKTFDIDMREDASVLLQRLQLATHRLLPDYKRTLTESMRTGTR